MSDFGRNIQRIAKTADLQRQINDLLSQVAELKDKEGKLGDRSVAYQTSSGGVGQSSGDKGASPVEADVASALKDFTDGALDVFSDDAGNASGTGADGKFTAPEGADKYKLTLPAEVDSKVKLTDYLVNEKKLNQEPLVYQPLCLSCLY